MSKTKTQNHVPSPEASAAGQANGQQKSGSLYFGPQGVSYARETAADVTLSVVVGIYRALLACAGFQGSAQSLDALRSFAEAWGVRFEQMGKPYGSKAVQKACDQHGGIGSKRGATATVSIQTYATSGQLRSRQVSKAGTENARMLRLAACFSWGDRDPVGYDADALQAEVGEEVLSRTLQAAQAAVARQA